MTVDAAKCRSILDATSRTGNPLTVAFNYRYNPVHERVWRLLHEQVIGEILSVHFEWLLDVRHGADYFRRWHREKAASGGLMVHKASHHFDLVNWWLASEPQEVFGYGRLGFYGAEAGIRHGLRRDYRRALQLAAGPGGSLCAGHFRPRAAEGTVPRRRNGQRLHPRPERLRRRDQHRGRHGRARALRQRSVNDVPPDGLLPVGGLPGDVQRKRRAAGTRGHREPLAAAAGRDGPAPFTERPRCPTPAVPRSGCEGCGSRRPTWPWPAATAATAVATSGCWPRCTVRWIPAPNPNPRPGDAARQSANQRDGALALAVGIAANECFLTGQPVRVADLIVATQ